jgi:hypothetical protein
LINLLFTIAAKGWALFASGMTIGAQTGAAQGSSERVDFTAIPTLDFTWVDSGRKEEFLRELQHAVLNVGFLYLKGTEARVPTALLSQMKVSGMRPGLYVTLL